jgi:DNA-binding NtrC family response regulator
MIKLNTLNLKEVEKAVVIEAIKTAKGNLTFARELLNIHKATMYRFIKFYGLRDLIESLKDEAEMKDFSFNNKESV